MPFKWPDWLPLASLVTLIFTIIVFVARMRFAAGGQNLSAISSKTPVRVPATIPYMVPFLGHYITFCYKEPFRWIEQISCKEPYQVFAAYILGRKFYVLSKQNLIKALFTNYGASLSFTPVRSYLLVNVFGARRSHTEASSADVESALSSFSKHARGEGLSRFISRLVKILQEEGPNLVSFSESVVDENLWERLSNPRIVSQKTNLDEEEACLAVEVDMFALIRNFAGLMTIRSLMGTDWADSNSTFVDMLWTFDDGWGSMLMGLPRWLPIPGLSKAYIARRSLCKSLVSFHQAVDNEAASETSESMNNDIDEVSQLLKDRCSVWRAHHIADSVKASADLSLLWAATVKSGNLLFWMLFYIYSSPILVSDIRLEITPYLAATQPANVFGIPEPPRLTIIDVDGLSDSCPLLKAVFYESLRLHSRPLSVRQVTKSFSFTNTCNNAPPSPTLQRFEIESGAYMVAPLGQQETESFTLEASENFNLKKFLSVDHNGKRRCNDAAGHPWGLGEAACPGRIFAEKQVILFVAAIVSLWDIEPTSLGNWEIPKPNTNHVVARPKKDCRILVRARKLGSRE